MFNKILTIAFALALVTVFIYVNIAKAQIVTEGLVSYWSFDRDTIEGKTVEDICGEHDGTMFGSPKIVDGKVGQALKFDGEEDYIEVADSEEFKISEKAITVEAWVKIESLPGKYAMLFSKRGTEYMVGIDAEGEPACFFLGDNSVGSVNERLPEGLWQHLVWSWDESSGQSFIYLNGEEVGDYVTADKSPNSTDPVNIARDPGTADPSSYHFNGILDEIRFYNRALNATEVEQNRVAKGLAVVERADTLSTTWARIRSF